MWRRSVFFWTEALQITAGERRVMLTLTLICLMVSGLSFFGPSRTVYDKSYYEPVIEEFLRLSRKQEQEREIILARYYPPGNPPRETQTLLNGYQTEAPHPERRLVLLSDTSASESGKSEGNGRTGEREEPEQPQQKDGKKPVNIQSAGKEALMTLTGIGPVTADRIIAYREEHGRFEKPEDLLNVSGIGPVTLKNISEDIIVD